MSIQQVHVFQTTLWSRANKGDIPEETGEIFKRLSNVFAIADNTLVV